MFQFHLRWAGKSTTILKITNLAVGPQLHEHVVEPFALLHFRVLHPVGEVLEKQLDAVELVGLCMCE